MNKNTIIVALGLSSLLACNKPNSQTALSSDNSAQASTDIRTICGYFQDPSADPDYSTWLQNRPLPPLAQGLPSRNTPVVSYTLTEKVKDDQKIDFKSYELLNTGTNKDVLSLRSSVFELMQEGAQYCVKAQLIDGKQALILSARRQ